jgi:uncharacterized protein
MTLVGAGYRPELADLFHGEQPVAECAELVANRYFAETGFSRPWELRALAGLPVIVHGLCGNVSSVYGPDADYLREIRRLADAVNPIICSDHLAFTGVPGRSLGHLAPNLYDDELLAAAARHISMIADATGRRVCLENLSTKTTISGSQYSPEEFFLRLLEESHEWDCLLDVTNIWINSQNRPVDAVDFIDALPPDRISYLHLAGGRHLHGEWIDTHSRPVHEEVFELVDHLLGRASPTAIIIERDTDWSGAEDELRADLDRVREILARRARLATPAPGPARHPMADLVEAR